MGLEPIHKSMQRPTSATCPLFRGKRSPPHSGGGPDVCSDLGLRPSPEDRLENQGLPDKPQVHMAGLTLNTMPHCHCPDKTTEEQHGQGVLQVRPGSGWGWGDQ